MSSQTPQTLVTQGQLDAAKAGRRATASQLLPTVTLIAGITQTEGQGHLLRLSNNLWVSR